MQLNIQTDNKIEMVDITQTVINEIKSSSIINGLCVISTQHTTTAIFVNENEPGLLHDVIKLVNHLVPETSTYRHNLIDNNAVAHLKSIILGNSESIPIIDGKLVLGRWQSIFLAEFDGPKTRKLSVTLLNQL